MTEEERYLRESIEKQDHTISCLEKQKTKYSLIIFFLALLCAGLLACMYGMSQRINDLEDEAAYYQEKSIDG